MSSTDVRHLILAAGYRDEQALGTVDAVGPQRVASLLVQELLDRSDPLGRATGDATVRAQFVLRAGERDVAHRVLLGPDGAAHEPGRHDHPDVTVHQDLLDLLRGVYGPRAERTDLTRRLEWSEDMPDGMVPSRWLAGVPPAVHRLLRGAGDGSSDLAELSLALGSDKWGLHYYPEHYVRHFEPLRDRPLTVLELGIGGYGDPTKGGGSLRMWKHWFPRAMVYGLDVTDKRGVDEQRIRTFRGDQADPGVLDEVLATIGTPPDIVIDDGSHLSADVIASFRHLWPRLACGGVYVVEDVQTSYWPEFGGSSTRLGDPDTSVGFLKALVDGLNHEEFEPPSARVPAATDASVRGLHFYHNIAFVDKGLNREGSTPGWIPRRPITFGPQSR